MYLLFFVCFCLTDVCVAAETGSGKTGSFALPIVQIVHETLVGQAQASGESSAAKKDGTGPATLNPWDRDAIIALDPSGLKVQARAEKSWAGVRGTYGVFAGKYYFEATVTDEGLARVGWSSRSASYDLGTDGQGFGFGGTGKKSFNRSFQDYGVAYGKGDVIGCYYDAPAGKIGFTHNGNDLGVAFDVPNHLKKVALYPAVVLKNAEMLFNFGATPFTHAPPAGFEPFASAPIDHTSEALARLGPVKGKKVTALVLEPTRDLAEQTATVMGGFRKYLPHPGIAEPLLLIGGVNTHEQVAALKSGVDIVVGTPGRIVDWVQQGKLDLSALKFFVMDEADSVLDQTGLKPLEALVARLPPTRQTLIMSATLHSPGIKGLMERIMKFPTWIDLKGKDAIPDSVDFAVLEADPSKYVGGIQGVWNARPTIATDRIHNGDNVLPPKGAGQVSREVLSQGVKLLKPHLLRSIIDAYDMDQALIFVRTKVDADNLEKWLNDISGGNRMAAAYSCRVLHGDRSVGERRANLDAFRGGEVRFLICTDVAARGIDIKGLPYVINYTLPDKAEEFIHRVGRVGRAERVGLAISIVSTVEEKVWYHSCNSKGRSCSNAKLTTAGGCGLWYDEPSYWLAIQERVGYTIPVLDSNFKLPDTDQNQYGKRKGASEANSVFASHAESLKPAVATLAQMEKSVQLSFLNFQFNAKAIARGHS